MVQCQCPERGDLHFYHEAEKKKAEKTKKCVNALKGATFISTINSGRDGTEGKMCQCPERGDLHFYIIKGENTND